MAHRVARFALTAAVGLLLVIGASAATQADHGDGHLQDWLDDAGSQDGLQQGLIAGSSVSVCSPEFPLSTPVAVARWNASGALNFQAFTWVTSCPSATVSVTTGSFFTFCDSVNHACVNPTPPYVTGDPNYEIVNPTFVLMNPNIQIDNSSHTTRDVTHELGHVLGHADYFLDSLCTGVGPTLMDSNENCWFDTPQTIDVNNYAAAYSADAVTTLNGQSTSLGFVQLTWNPSNVHNEDALSIQRDGAFIASVGKNATSWSSGGQPSGQHTYAVVSHTNAWCLAFGGYCGSVSTMVNVQGAVDYEPTAYTPNPACGSCNEGGSKSFTISVRNNGNVTAPVSTVAMKFNGQTAPNPYGGVCNLPEIPAGATRSCTNINPVSLSFAGGPITLHADYTNVVPNESNEANNNSPAIGTMYVVPNAPSNQRVCPACDLYGYKDNSGIETGFTIKIQRRSGGCGTTGWSTVSTINHGPKSGTDDVYFYNFTSGYCWRIKVSSKTQFTSNEVTSPGVNLP